MEWTVSRLCFSWKCELWTLSVPHLCLKVNKKFTYSYSKLLFDTKRKPDIFCWNHSESWLFFSTSMIQLFFFFKSSNNFHNHFSKRAFFQCFMNAAVLLDIYLFCTSLYWPLILKIIWLTEQAASTSWGNSGTCFILASSRRVCSSLRRSFLLPTRMMGTLGQKCFTSGVHFSGMFSVHKKPHLVRPHAHKPSVH